MSTQFNYDSVVYHVNVIPVSVVKVSLTLSLQDHP